MAELFTDEMDESQIIEAFTKQGDEPEAVEEVAEATDETVEAPETAEMEQPSSETEEVTSEASEEVTEPAQEESTPDVLDFSSPVMLKDRDIDLPITSSDEMRNLALKGLNYTRKTQELAKYRSTIDYMSQHGITMENLQTLAESQRGNPEALGQLAKNAGIDPYDISTDKPFVPNQQFAPQQLSEVDFVAQEIQQDPGLANDFRGMMDYVPDSFKDQLGTNPDTLRKFSTDVKSGIAKQLLPEALKLHAMNGGDFVQSYIQAGNSVFGGQHQQQAEASPEPVQEKAPVSPNRAKASISSAKSTSSGDMGFDVWNASDEALMDKIDSLTRLN